MTFCYTRISAVLSHHQGSFLLQEMRTRNQRMRDLRTLGPTWEIIKPSHLSTEEEEVRAGVMDDSKEAVSYTAGLEHTNSYQLWHHVQVQNKGSPSAKMGK